MASEGNWSQSSSDRESQYQGSLKQFYVGSTIGSSTAWSFINFSGTNTGFGPANNVLSNRVAFAGSANSITQFSFNSGVDVHGDLYPGDSFTMDGKSVSGVWIRAASTSQQIRIWAW